MANLLTWDAAEDRKYETGVDHGVLRVKNGSAYEKSVAWSGLSNVTESPEGAEPTSIYADNIKYATFLSAEELNGTIECYVYPDEFLACDGIDATTVPGAFIHQQDRAHFCLAYRTQYNDAAGNKNYKYHILFDCLAKPSEKAYASVNDSPEAGTFSYEITCNPVQFTVGESGSEVTKTTCNFTIDTSKITGTDEEKAAKLKALEEYIFGDDDSGSTPFTIEGLISAIEAAF